jgi:hypothetical protein
MLLQAGEVEQISDALEPGKVVATVEQHGWRSFTRAVAKARLFDINGGG